jgi:hypothetical protein
MATIDAIARYDQEEQEALRKLPNRIIEAVQPAGFHFTSYPTRIGDERELWRYADVMQDRRAGKILDGLGGLTRHEFDLWAKATEHATVVTEELGHRIVPRNAPLAAVESYRVIKTFYDDPTVFEVGPGSGYLGKMFLLAGRSYCSTDVTQAFSLWQSKFLGARQIPWWQWFDYAAPPTSAHAIVVNHALCEMSENALRYLIVRVERILTDTGTLFAEGFGASYLRTAHQTVEIFLRRGWKFIELGVGSYVFLPPRSVGLPPRKPVDEIVCKWNEIENVWLRLGAKPNPDDAFLDFIGSTIE